MTDTTLDLGTLEAIASEGPRPQRPASNSVAARLAALEPEARAIIESILFSDDPRWTNSAAARELSGAGFKIARTTVRDLREIHNRGTADV